MIIKKLTLMLLCSFYLFSQSLWARSLAPETVAGATTVTTKRAKSLMNQGVIFVDVRGIKYYADEHIQWAVHLDVKSTLTEASLLKVVAKDKPVVFYCNGEWCKASSIASQKAVAWGWTKVFYYRGGIPEWEKANLPLE